MDTRNVFDTGARYSKPRIKEPQDFSCPKTLKVVSVTFHAPLDLTIHDSQGMYDPGAEHDACGVGMVTTLNKRPERKIVDDAIEVLVNLNHRGAVGAEENTGDGAGILMSMPDEFMRATAGVELPEEGHYAAGIAFLDRDIATSGQQEQAISKIVREEGLEVLAWRVVPTNPDGLGLQALASMPAFKTLVVADPEGELGGIELDRKTFRIRKRVEHEVGIYFASLSARTITYKGMLTTMQLKPFFLDLSDERMKAKIASCIPASPPTRSQAGRWHSRSASWRTTARSTPSKATATGCPHVKAD